MCVLMCVLFKFNLITVGAPRWTEKCAGTGTRVEEGREEKGRVRHRTLYRYAYRVFSKFQGRDPCCGSSMRVRRVRRFPQMQTLFCARP